MLVHEDMLAANNLAEMFGYIFPIVGRVVAEEGISLILNRQNSTGNTPLRKECFI